ncbi:MAG TPA: tetratricopeptide repeat protein, partial [Candidatus Wallbacteria bacterium]|nr:tetratricopeptide repeat protein [Candidatus Wallbacteria bacterium]
GRVKSAGYGFKWALKELAEARKIFYARGIFDEKLYNDMLFEELRAYVKEGEFKIAEELLVEAYELSVKLYGEESFMTARIEGQKAHMKYCSSAVCEFHENMEYFTGAVAKMMKYCSADSDPFLLAEQYYRMFKMELKFGDFETSLECLKFVEKIIAVSLGPYSEAMINLYMSAMVEFDDLKKYPQCFELIEKVIACKLEMYGGVNKYVEASFFDAALNAMVSKDFKTGVKFHEKHAALMSTSPVDLFPKNCQRMVAGEIYRDAGEYVVAEELFLSFVKDADQKNIMEAFENLSKLEAAVGNHAKALEYYQKHMQLYDADEAHKKYKTYDKFLDISIMYEQAGEFDKAVENIDAAFADLTRSLPDSWDDSYMKPGCSKEKEVSEYWSRQIGFLERIIASGIFSGNSKDAALFHAYFILGVLYFKSSCYSNSMIKLMKATKMADAGCAKSRDEKDVVKFMLLKCLLCNCYCAEVFDDSVRIFAERLEISGCDKITLNFAVMAGIAAYKNCDIECASELFTWAGEIFNTLGVSEDDKYAYK